MENQGSVDRALSRRLQGGQRPLQAEALGFTGSGSRAHQPQSQGHRGRGGKQGVKTWSQAWGVTG